MENKYKPKIGLITVGLDGERLDLAEKFQYEALKKLSELEVEVIAEKDVKINNKSIYKTSINFANKNADILIFLIGTWVSAPDIVTTILNISIPTVVWGIPDAASFSSVGANVVHGSLDELGVKHKLIYGHPGDIDIITEILIISKAAKAKNILKNSRLGLIGGRSIGMYPSSGDPIQIKKLFGIEIEHIDQLLLVKKAIDLEDSEIKSKYKDLSNYFNFDSSIPKEAIFKSLRLYTATKQIIKERELDFVSIKCLEELINTYISCCLSNTILNNEGIVTSCQCDINATITMKLLNILTDGPAIFADINLIDVNEKIARLINCGTMPTKLASGVGEVSFGYQYEYMGKARGVCPYFCCKEGEVTLGMLNRINGEYVMLIFRGEAFLQSKQVFKEDREIWPHMFVKLSCDTLFLYQNIRSNHVAVGYGRVEKELKEYCDLINIKTIIIN